MVRPPTKGKVAKRLLNHLGTYYILIVSFQTMVGVLEVAALKIDLSFVSLVAKKFLFLIYMYIYMKKWTNILLIRSSD